MNRSFEQEYREMMNKQTPDLWDRIEAGVKASDRSNSVITGIDDLRKETEIKKEKKRFPNYYQVMAVAGVAACFAVLAVGAPAVKQSMNGKGRGAGTYRGRSGASRGFIFGGNDIFCKVLIRKGKFIGSRSAK